MLYLRAKLYAHEKRKQMESRAELRSAAHGTGDRTDKIRTYNFPQDRITDHRVPVTVMGMERMMNGELLNDITDSLINMDENERMEKFLEKLK
jgi:peptide chain release factor 1